MTAMEECWLLPLLADRRVMPMARVVPDATFDWGRAISQIPA